jgi:spore coat protein A, manganese oxidase
MATREISRKEFIGISAGAAAGAALASSGMAPFLAKKAQAATPALTQFVDELPIPPLLRGANQSLRIAQTTQKFHTALPPTPVWGYNGGGYSGYLGPTVEAQKGTQTTVSYANALPTTHLLKVDPTITQMRGKPLNSRILTHLHGGHISSTADGNPFASNDFLSGQTQRVPYANDQEAAHLWYHDHALGITRLNVMAGLAAHYLLRDAVDNGRGGNFPDYPGRGLPFTDPDRTDLPKYEIPLAIQDRTFTRNGQLDYPANWQPEFFGDVVTVNGKIWPYLNVEPRRYRFRILNGSNSRFYNLQLSNGQAIFQIGTDGGFLPQPVERRKLLIAPGERADVVIDFAEAKGTNVRLVDTDLPEGTENPADPLEPSDIMRFNVGAAVTVAHKPLPTQLRSGSFSVGGRVAKTRFLTLEEILAGPVPKAVVLNGMGFLDQPVTEKPKLNTAEIWNLINISADTHPIHLHLVQFQILGRQTIDVAKYQAALDAARARAGGPVDANGELVNPDPAKIPGCVTGTRPVEANELGPKDTVQANPGQVTTIKARFDRPGRYVWHCHILEHEDNDMMRPYDVV